MQPIETEAEAPPPRLLARKSASAAAALAFALLAGWLLLPALTPGHLEGFTAALGALGVHLTQGDVGDFDRLFGLDLEYYALTKLGAALAVAGLIDLLHASSDLAMRLMMWSGFAALFAGACLLARRWSGAPWWLVLPLPLLIPGVVESAFIYNDNIPSAGLAALGLCLLYERGAASFAGAGLLFGLAVLTRADTVLIGAAVPIIVWERFGRSRRTLLVLVMLGVAAAVALFGPLAWFHATPLDVVTVGSEAVKIWNRPTVGGKPMIIVLYYLGVPGVVLVAAGLAALAARRDYAALARLTAGPILLLAFTGDKLWEIRQLLALSPFVCALAAIGLKAIYAGRETAARRVLRPLTAALAVLSLAAPIAGLRLQDGPRVLSGRLWAIPLWRAWQAGPRHDFEVMDRLIGAVVPGTTQVLFADDWNEDRYLHLRLLDAGYSMMPVETVAPQCRRVAEPFARGPSRIVLLRLHHPVVPYWREIKEARLKDLAMPCLGALPNAQPFFVASALHIRSLLPEAGVTAAPAANDPRHDPLVWSLSYGPIVAVPLPAERQAQLLGGYRREAAALASRGKSGEALLRDANAATRARTRFPG